jgi:two-component system, LytTR family, sensor kinase
MKVRWREHEIILVTITAACALISYSLYMRDETAMSQLKNLWDNNRNPLSQSKFHFNLYRNVLVPGIGMGLLIYLSYLWIALYTIPRLLSPKKFEAGTAKISFSFKKTSLQGMARKLVREYAWLFIQIVLLTFLLGTAMNIAIYFRHEWQFHYPGFSIFFNKNNPNSQMDIYGNYAAMLFIIAVYAAYVTVREVIINFIERSGTRSAYRILICDQVTAFLVIYISVPLFVLAGGFIHEGPFFAFWFSFALPIFPMYLSNTYWLFPLKGEKSFFHPTVIIRLLFTAFIYNIPFVLFPFHEGFAGVIIVSWSIQLFIVTPITWLLYQQRKDKILALRGAEKALVKSKANLQFLRSQINPHFLFNVLNTLYGTALQENAGLTAGGIQQLGDMMRFMLHENNLDFIQMEREMEYLKNYISLQKLRTQSSPDIVIEDNFAEQNCLHKIAPMLLIPLVENAFKHGISLTEKSWIKIKLNCTEKDIIFEVRNSMHPKADNDPEKDRSGIGFNNVLERLKLIYPGRHQISVNGDGKEFFVQLAIQP